MSDNRQPTSASAAAQDAALHSDANRPKRVMGLTDLILFYVVTGISLRWIATAAAAGPSSIVVWIVAWFCFYTPLALSVIELSSRHPEEGGLYVWSKKAFGDFSGFMAAWTYWTSNLPYFPAILYFAASNILYVRQENWGHYSADPKFFIIFSLVGLTLATVLNIVGLNIARWLHNIGAVAMWIPAMIVMVMGFVALHRFGSATRFTAATMRPSFHLNDMIFWSLLIFAFAGCETGSMMGDEIKNPRRVIPWSLFLAGISISICYILGTATVLFALPASAVGNMQGLMQAIASTAGKVGFVAVIPVTAALIAISNIGACGGYLAATARLPFVAGIDHFLPRAFGLLHPRWKTPWVALLTQSTLGALFIFLGQAGTSVKGAYDVLVAMTVIAYFLPFLYLFAAMFKLQSEPAGPEVMRVPGRKPVAYAISIVGFTATLFTIVISALPQPDEPNKPLALLKVVGGSAVVVGVGALIYWMGKRRAEREG